MGPQTIQIEHLLRTEGLVVLAERPDLEDGIRWLHRTGRLCRVVPGVYAAAGATRSAEILIAAVARGAPRAVLTGAAAARVTFWPDLPVPVVTASHPHTRQDHPGIAFSKRRIPDRLIWHLAPDPLRPVLPSGLRCTTAALTTWDLSDTLGGDAVDEALRRRAATLGELREALDLTPGRRGNLERRRLLLDSRSEPWSRAERRAHRIFRRAGFTGWRANHPVTVGGRRYRLDVAWSGLKLAVEIDGRRWHSAADVFETDRQRQNDLVAAGWTVVRLTWAMLDDEAEVVRVLAAVIRRLQHRKAASR